MRERRLSLIRCLSSVGREVSTLKGTSVISVISAESVIQTEHTEK